MRRFEAEEEESTSCVAEREETWAAEVEHSWTHFPAFDLVGTWLALLYEELGDRMGLARCILKQVPDLRRQT